MKFRKKPVIVEAEQYIAGQPAPRGVCWELRSEDGGEISVPYVITIHDQRAYLADGDWVLPEPDGEHFYPCKPDIFSATYEPVE